ncbi:hypothetical protein [Actinomadura rupiterrae]|uniref:hypothetical protein n=1 Tax=Actinomadura rupiterrae TaxID=559627 RepID=UPI0020A23C44|nr:hypothetical protein [Actinomadura rupiterrae]MCP2340964.1 hypothetical protein [Actinomadura rupiterrae]
MTPADTTRDGISDRRLATRLGLAQWQLRLAKEHDLLPEPDLPDGRWGAETAARCAERVDAVKSAFGDRPPIGAERAAARLAARVKLDVERADIEVLAAQNALDVVGLYRDHPLYLLRDLDALASETVTQVVRARKGPLVDSVEPRGALRILDWPRPTFERIAMERNLAVDRLGRYALADIQNLAKDDDLKQRVETERRQSALLKAKREEKGCEDGVRAWLQDLNAYLEHGTSEPPPTAALRRALRALITARAVTAGYEP